MIQSLENLKKTIINLVDKNDVVVIAPHLNPDCDAISGALGLYMIVKSLNKTPVILISEDYTSLDRGVQIILDEIPDSVKIVGKKSVSSLLEDRNALLICVDNNKKDLFPVDNYNNFSDVLIVDHHAVGKSTILTHNSYIDLLSSSTAEIVVNLLDIFNIKLDYREEDNPDVISNIANYLLSGIYLDTDGLKSKRARSTTFMALSLLIKSGAEMSYASSLFIDDIKTDILVHDMVKVTDWKKYNIAIASNKQNPDFLYTKEVLAKIADTLLRYNGTDAAFSIGCVQNDVVHISGRSKGLLNMDDIMKQFGGGGNEMSGAARIPESDVLTVRSKLERVLTPGYKLK